MKIQELKKNSPAQLIEQAEKLGIENASTLRKQKFYLQYLKSLQKRVKKLPEWEFFNFFKMVGFLRALESNYLPGADDIYVSPSQIRNLV